MLFLLCTSLVGTSLLYFPVVRDVYAWFIKGSGLFIEFLKWPKSSECWLLFPRSAFFYPISIILVFDMISSMPASDAVLESSESSSDMRSTSAVGCRYYWSSTKSSEKSSITYWLPWMLLTEEVILKYCNHLDNISPNFIF